MFMHANYRQSLIKAVRENDDYALKELLKTPQDLNFHDEYGLPPLHWAILGGNVNTIVLLVLHGARLSFVDLEGRSSLSYAASLPNHELHEFVHSLVLRECGYPESTKTALHIAAASGWSEVVSQLLNAGDNYLALDAEGLRPIDLAVRTGHLDCFMSLLHMPGSSDPCATDGLTIFHRAILSGQIEIVSKLIELEFNVDTLSTYGMTPLHCVIHVANPSITEMFLTQSLAFFDEVNQFQLLMMHIALQLGEYSLLDDALTNPEIKSAQFTEQSLRNAALTLMSAIIAKDDPIALAFFLEDEMIANTKNFIAIYGLIKATENGCVDLMPILCRANGSSLEVNTSQGNLAHFASRGGHVAMLEWLNQQGVSLTDQDYSSHNTPLHVAAEYGHLAAVNFFLTRYDNIDIRNRWAETPLLLAVRNKHISVANRLLEQGADVNCQNDDRLSPLHLAVNNQDLNMALLLLNTYQANPSLEDENQEDVAHYVAEVMDDVDFLKQVFAKGASPYHVDLNRCNRLHHAIYYGSLNSMAYLLSFPTLDIQLNNEMLPPLLNGLAHSRSNPIDWSGIIAKFYQINGQIDYADRRQLSTLHYAARAFQHTAISTIVMASRFDVNIRDNYQRNALHIMFDDNFYLQDYEDFILDHQDDQEPDQDQHQDENQSDESLEISARERFEFDMLVADMLATLESLKKEGIDFNALDINDNSPLMLAAKAYILPAVVFLCKESSDESLQIVLDQIRSEETDEHGLTDWDKVHQNKVYKIIIGEKAAREFRHQQRHAAPAVFKRLLTHAGLGFFPVCRNPQVQLGLPEELQIKIAENHLGASFAKSRSFLAACMRQLAAGENQQPPAPAP